MADIETSAISENFETRCDYTLAGGSLASANDLKTAVLISLFTDRRAEVDDVLPDERTARRGWWGDSFAPRRIGSRFWLLNREKTLQAVVNRCREYAKEALAWMVEDGICSHVEVDAAHAGKGVLNLSVMLSKYQSAPDKFRFDYAWGQLSGV